jgi:hypothetical protein
MNFGKGQRLSGQFEHSAGTQRFPQSGDNLKGIAGHPLPVAKYSMTTEALFGYFKCIRGRISLIEHSGFLAFLQYFACESFDADRPQRPSE